MPVIKEKIMENLISRNQEGCHIFSLPIPSGYLQLTARIKFAEENNLTYKITENGIRY
jgi:hypothetical protein